MWRDEQGLTVNFRCVCVTTAERPERRERDRNKRNEREEMGSERTLNRETSPALWGLRLHSPASRRGKARSGAEHHLPTVAGSEQGHSVL